jgi:hypothetical protein
MLDSSDNACITKRGKVAVDRNGVIVSGFEGKNVSCREVAALAIVWAIGQLQGELEQLLRKPGGGNVAVD